MPHDAKTPLDAPQTSPPPASTSPGGAPQEPAADALTQIYLSEENEDRRSLRFSLAVALAAHVMILFAAIPELQSKEVEPPEPKKVIQLAPTPKYQKPPPPPPDAPKPRQKTHEIPMPDPDPDYDVYVPDDPQPVVELTLDDVPFGLIPDEPPIPEATGPIRIGGQIAPPKRVHYVAPTYPEIARRARIEGTVILEATIDTEGRVVDLKVLKGRPFGLSEAAVEAASKWRFEPSKLGDTKVPVLYVVTVHFNLQ